MITDAPITEIKAISSPVPFVVCCGNKCMWFQINSDPHKCIHLLSASNY